MKMHVSIKLHEFLRRVSDRAFPTFGVSTERVGQALYNELCDVRPDLAARMRGTDMDPFYARHVEDVRYQKALTFIAEEWNDDTTPVA